MNGDDITYADIDTTALGPGEESHVQEFWGPGVLEF
jgi:hypothetical protein